MVDADLERELVRLAKGQTASRPSALQPAMPQPGAIDTPISDAVKELLRFVPPVELLRFVSISEAARLSTLSEDSLVRHHGDRVVDLGPRRRGMRIVDALLLRHAREGPSAVR